MLYMSDAQGTSAREAGQLVGKPKPRVLKETQCRPRPARAWVPPLAVGDALAGSELYVG